MLKFTFTLLGIETNNRYYYCICKRYDNYTVKPVLRGHLWDKEQVVFQDR